MSLVQAVPSTPRVSTVIGNAVPVTTQAVPTVEASVRIREMLGDNLEAHSRGLRPLLPGYFRSNLHGFMHAAVRAFADHHNLTISPDMIWLMIAQGFAYHINQDAEAFRTRFVAHSGKQQIVVIRDEFVRGFEGNDWEGVFSEFSQQIQGIVGEDKHSLIVQTFSTTGIVEQAAIEVSLMDAMQSCFDYRLITRCGIPYFNIEGEPSDWRKLRDAAARLEEYDLEWWIPTLLPLLDQFVAASEGIENPEFWGSFFKMEGMSGGPYISGHILQFFPYILDHNSRIVCNRFITGTEKDDWATGITTMETPCGFSVAPFTWEYYRTRRPMEFVAGFIGVTQDVETYALRPEIGWTVRNK